MSNLDMSLRTSAIVSFSTLSRSKSRRLQNSECLCIEICLKKYFTTSIAPIILLLVKDVNFPAGPDFIGVGNFMSNKTSPCAHWFRKYLIALK